MEKVMVYLCLLFVSVNALIGRKVGSGGVSNDQENMIRYHNLDKIFLFEGSNGGSEGGNN
ncbi:MAG: hypothetical protein WC682_05480 [Parcubacteria group bacterium]|jgi:hypothetical protein